MRQAATNATMPRHIWMDAVRTEIVARGADPEWSREECQRSRLNLYYSAGEPVYMAAEALMHFWRGLVKAEKENHDGREIIRSINQRERNAN